MDPQPRRQPVQYLCYYGTFITATPVCSVCAKPMTAVLLGAALARSEAVGHATGGPLGSAQAHAVAV